MNRGTDAAETATTRWLGVELALTGGLLVVALGLVWTLLAASPVRTAAALVILLWLPGYALTTLVFPARTGSVKREREEQLTTVEGTPGPRRATLTGWERAALSFGLSVALIPLYGFVLASQSLSFERPNVVFLVGGATMVFLVAGAIRRARASPQHRYVLPLPRWRRQGRAVLEGERIDVALTVGLAVAVLLATASFAGAIVAPPDGSTYTQTALLTEQPNGELAAADYDTDFVRGDQTDLVLELKNREGERTDYTAVVLLQRMTADGRVVEQRQLKTLRQTVAPGRTWRADHTVTLEMAGDRLRLTYLLYRGDPPTTLRVDSAYRHLSLSISVEAN